MTVLTTTTEVHPFTPRWREKEDKAPVYHLRAGNVIERGQMEAELAGPYRAGKVYPFELREAIRSGVMRLLAEDPDLDRILGLIAADSQGEVLSDEDAALFGELRGVLAENWPAYRDLVAQLERRREIAPIVAFRRFCTGWTNVAATFTRSADGLIDMAVLGQIDAMEMLSAGNEAYRLLYPDASAEGNSSPAASSESGRTTSPSDDTSKGAGKSRAATGKKTRAPRSRRGSGRSSTSTS